MDKVTVISREEIPEVNKVDIQGREKSLGIVKNLSSIAAARSFIPDRAHLCVSWVSLGKNKQLDTHTHPIHSLYIITEGEGILLGELAGKTVKSGDIILIPKYCRHGFIGSGEYGYWALSIQFDQRGIYEDTNNPLVSFENIH